VLTPVHADRVEIVVASAIHQLGHIPHRSTKALTPPKVRPCRKLLSASQSLNSAKQSIRLVLILILCPCNTTCPRIEEIYTSLCIMYTLLQPHSPRIRCKIKNDQEQRERDRSRVGIAYPSHLGQAFLHHVQQKLRLGFARHDLSAPTRRNPQVFGGMRRI
jgi:hypothetical protein